MPDAAQRPCRSVALPATVALAAFALHAATACPTVFFGDSGELIAAAQSLGVAHPPGYPLYTALGRLALALPGGEPAWRMNLLSALFGALACGAAAWLVARWGGSVVGGAAAGLLLATSSEFWSAATVAEVYTLHLLLLVLLLAAAERLREPREGGNRSRVKALLAAALVLGLGLSHRPTILLALPAALVVAWPALKRARHWLGARAALASAALLLGTPLLFYGTLILRSRAGPAANWGRPDDLARMISHATARGYDFYVIGPAGWLRAEAWERLADLLWNGFSYGTAPLALLGLVAALRQRGPGRRAGAALLALGLPLLLFGLSYGTEDLEVLFLPLGLVTALLAGLGIGALSSVLPRRGSFLGLLLTAVLLCAQLLLHFPSHNLRRVTAAADYGRDLLATLPRNGVIFVAGDDSFVLAYLIQVLGERRDVQVYDQLGLLFDDELSEPGAPPRPGEPRLAYRARREQRFIVSELAQSDGRRVFFVTWPGYALPRGLTFEPVGLLYEARRSGRPPREADPLWQRYHEAAVREQALRLDHPFARTIAAVYPLMRGERELWRGQRPSALASFAEAGELAGASETIHNHLGTIFGRLGEYGMAVREFEAALAAKPLSARAWNNLGLARRLAGDVDGAREAWRESLRIQPAQPDTRRLLREVGG
jgi:tetratricopeptide (TPR) repeat protein